MCDIWAWVCQYSRNHLCKSWSYETWGRGEGRSGGNLNSNFSLRILLLSTYHEIPAHFSLLSHLDDKVLGSPPPLLEVAFSEDRICRWELCSSTGIKLFQGNLNLWALHRLRMGRMGTKTLLLYLMVGGPLGQPEASWWYARLCLHSPQDRKEISKLAVWINTCLCLLWTH